MSENTKITKTLVNKLIKTVNCGLTSGIGVAEPGKMCVEAAVCYAYGIQHSDKPPCVGEAVRAFKVSLNDSNWSSNEARAKGMLSLSIAQLNSNVLDQSEFAKKLVLKLANTVLADLAKKYLPSKESAFRLVDDLDKLILLCEELNRAASAARYAARCAASAASAARYAAGYTVRGAASGAARYAARCAASAASGAASDKVLVQAADACLEVLKEMKSEGCDYLYLIKENGK